MVAILLSRVSTEEQKDGYSLDAQHDRLVDYCGRKGLRIMATYKFDESAFSGPRKKFKQMLGYAKKVGEEHGCVALICDKIDRLTRNPWDLGDVEQLRQEGRLELHFVSENLVFGQKTSAGEEFVMLVLAGAARNYSASIRDNVMRAQERMAKEGRWFGHVPKGYRWVHRPNGEKTIELTADAPIMRELFNLRATGDYSDVDLHAFLADQGVCLAYQKVRELLANPFYKGYLTYHGQLYKHIYPVLIPEHIWEAAQREPRGIPTGHVFALTRLFRCGKCRYTMVTYSVKGHSYIRCKACRMNYREEMILQQLRAQLAPLLAFDFRRHLRQLNAAEVQKRQSIRLLSVQKERISQDIIAVTRMRARNELTGNSYKMSLTAMEKEYNIILSKLETQGGSMTLQYKQIIHQSREALANKSLSREFLLSVIDSALITNGRIELELKPEVAEILSYA